MRFLLQSLIREEILFIWDTLFVFFISSLFVWWYLLPISPSTYNFPFLQAFRFFLDLTILLLLSFDFSVTHYECWTFFLAKHYSYILAKYSYCLNQSLQLLLIIMIILTIPKGLVQGLEDLEIRGHIETIQNTALLKSAWILRRVHGTWGDLLPLKIQWKTIS